MAHRSRTSVTAALAGAAVIAATALPGCFGGGGHPDETVPVRTVESRLDGDVKVERLVYRSSDGTRVPALFASPRGVEPRGCLLWQDGLNSRKEDSARIFSGAARLGLAVFSIDLRQHGERAPNPAAARRAVSEPQGVAALVRGSVTDLRSGLDLLQERGECRRNFGYGGVSLGGAVGSVLAGRDRRIRATVIMSTPPTWRAAIEATDLILPRVERNPARLREATRILAPLDPMRWVARISPRPVMVLLGRDDPLVPRRAAALMGSAARPPKSVITYRGGHRPLGGPDAGRNARRIADFLLRWLVEPTYPL